MRTLVGEAPYTADNQPAILLMYRAWLFILSIGIVLPLRWLPHVFSKPAKLALPIATTAVMVTCGELLLNNPTITPSGPYCPGDQITITFTGSNLWEGENLDVFIGSTNSYNPFLGGGTQIGSIPIDYSCTTCPTLLGMMANPCGSDPENEYVLVSSGCGFNVDDLYFDLDFNNNTGVGNADPGSATCPFGTPDPTLISALQTGNCASLIFPAGPGDDIPGGANVIIFTDSGTPTQIPNLDDLCATGQPVYILQNSCARSAPAISNNATSSQPSRTYTIYTNGTCPDGISFGYDASYSPQNSEFRLEDGTLIQSSGCDAPFDQVNYPDIPINLVSLNYTLPSDICGSSSGPVNFYISGMVDIPGPCADLIYTPPSNGAIAVACPAIIDPAGPFCANAAPYNLTASNMPGGTWSGPGITDPNLGTFDPSVSGPGSHIISYTVGCPGGPSTATIVVYDEVVIDPTSFISANDVPCLGGFTDALFIGSYSGGSGNYTFDWDDANTPGNEVYPDDGNLSITGIPEGDYYFIVNDDLGCSDTLPFTIYVFLPPTITAFIDPINCFGGTTGVGFGINITVSGGPGGVLYYDWNLDGGANENFGGPPAVDDDSEDIYNLVAGTYYLTVTITDEFSYWCDYLDTFTITQPTQLTVTAPDVALPCFGNTTTPTATPSGGTPGYTYNWSHIGGSNNPPPWGPVGAGSYIVTVTDANGCTASDVMNVTQPSAALMASAVGETIDCDDNTGDINLTVTGGTPSYTFIWSPGGSTAEDPSGLNSGVYTVTVTDANGCTTTAQATILLNPPTFSPPPNDGSTVPCVSDAQVQPVPPPWNNSCGDPLNITGPSVSSIPSCEGVVTYTFTYTDPATSISADWVYTYTIDYVASLSPPPNQSQTVSCPGNATDPGAPANITDACGNVLSAVFVSVVSTPDPITCDGTVVYTYRYTACDGTTADWTYTYAVDFSSSLTPPANGSATVICPANAVDPGPPANITDACGNILTPVLIGSVSNPNPVVCEGTVIWTYRYTACDGTTADWTFTYTVDYSGALTPPANGSATVICPANAVDPGPPANINDACGNSLTPVLIGSTSNPNPIVCDGTVVWTYRYTACDGTTADWTFTYTVDYSGALMPPANGSATVTCPSNAVDPGAPANITDACGNTIMPVLIGSTSNPNPIICDGTVVWTYRYTACDGSTADWTFTYTVDYSGTLTPPANGSSTVICPANAVDPGAPASIPDACGNLIIPVLIGSTSNPNPITCDGTVVWTYRYTGCDGVFVDWTYTYTVDYSGALTPPANGSSTVSCPANAVDPGAPASITDACGRVLNAVLVGSVSNPNPVTCEGTVVWTYRYTACDGTTADWTYTYTVDYTSALAPPANGSSTVPCPTSAVDPGPPANITDACGNVLVPVLIGSTSNPNPIVCDGTVVWTYRYTACDGTTADWTYTYNVNFSSGLTPPANGSSTVTCPVAAVDPGPPSNITDACGNVLVPVLIGSTSNPNPIICDGTVVWTYRYTACDGTTADWTYTYTVDYSGALTPPANGSSTVTCPANAVDPGAPSNITDACGNTIIPTLIGSTSNPNPIICDGTVVWTYRYTACDGSTADWTYTYTVDYSSTLTPPANGSSTVPCPANAVDPGAPAPITDACGNTINATLIGSVSNPNPIVCDGTVIWTYRYTACDGTTADWTFTYTVDYSSALTPPANGSATVQCVANAVDPGPPSNITDACGNILVPVLIGSVSNPDPIVCDGTVIWTYRYTACDGATADWTFTYTVSFSGSLTPPANGSSTVTCPADAVDPGPPSNITDACGNVLVPVLIGSTSNPNPIVCDGTVIWTYRYTACDGSTADWTYTYTVDFSGSLTPPANGSSTVTCPADAVDPGAPSNITDPCGNTLIPVLIGSTSNPNPILCDGTVVWTYRYTACDGTTADWTYTYTVNYSGSLTPPANGSSTVTCPGDAVDPGAPANITDACGNTLVPVLIGSTSNPNPIICDGTVVWTYRYTACDGTTADWTYTYTVTYSGTLTPPANGSSTVTCPADAVDPGAPAPITDACGNTINATLIGSVSNPDPIVCDGTVIWTYQYMACDGSTADWTYTYTVDYSGALTPPANGSATVPCVADAVDPGAPANITDACGNTIVPVFIGSVSNPDPIVCDGTITYTYQYTACDGSTADWTFTYTISFSGSLVPPANGSSTVTCPGDAVDPGAPAPITDACGNTLNPVLIGSVSNPDPIICDGTVIWTYRYSACDGSTADWTYTYTVDYSGALTPPANGSSTVTCPGDAVDPGAPAPITDACGNTLNPVLIGSVSNPDPIICDGTVIWTYRYTACDGSTADWTYTYTVDYSGALTPPANGSSTVTCPGDAVDPGAPAPITDACGNTLNPVLIGSVSNPDPIICDGTVIWTYRYTACDGSTADWTYTYTIDYSGTLTPPANGSSTVPCAADAVDPGAPGPITDACGNTINATLIGSVSNPDPIVCDGTVIWTYQYMACDGTTADWTYTYTISFSGGLTPPANGSASVACAADAVDPGPPANITDACGNVLVPVFIGVVSNPDPIVCDGSVIYTYRYTACDGTTADWTFTYTITFSGGLTPPANGSSTVTCPADAVDPGAPANITDACGNILVPVLIGAVSNPDPVICDGTVIWTYQYTACDGTTADWTYTYTIDYSGALTPPANGSSTVTCPADAVDPGAPANITDACGNILMPVLIGSTSNPNPIICDGTVVWTYQYTACDGTTADWTYTYTVDYSSSLTPPANGSSTVTCPADAVDPGAPANITDACGNILVPVLIGSTSNPDPIICDGTVVWTYRYTACDGTTVDWTYTYTVDYSGALTPPANGSSTVLCAADAVDPGAPANITDACGNTIIATLIGSVSNPDPIVCDGTVIWTYQYMACDGSTVDWTYTYTISFSGGLTPPANGASTVNCPTDAVDPGPPSDITDACGNVLSPVLVGSVSNPDPIVCDGTVVWTYRYTACDGTTADWTYTYTVDYNGALTPPANGSSTVTCPSDATDPGAPANITDACGNVLVPVLIGSVSNPDPIVCDGTVVWTYRYTACDGSTADWTYTYTVDYSGSLTPPANGSSTITCAADAVDPGAPSNVTDACGNILVPVLIGSTSNPDPVVCDGTVVWTYRYTACDGSTADWTYTYTIDFSSGLTPPANGSSTVFCPGDAVDPGAPANITDACGNILVPVLIGSTSNPDPIVCDGTVVWTYQYAACDGTTADWTYTYTVDYGGTLTPPADGSSTVACVADAIDPGAPAPITDACGNIINAVLVGSVSNPDPIVCDGTVVWTYQYTACDGSTADWTFTYTITFSGGLTPPANGSSTVACAADATDPGAPANITDACGNVLVPVLIGSVSNPDPIVCDGTVVWTYRYTACDGTTADWTYTYTVDYSSSLTPPANGSSTVLCPADAIDPGAPANITDACGNILVPVLIGSVSNPDPVVCDGTVIWTYQYTACDGSTADWTYTYTIDYSSSLTPPANGSSTVTCAVDAVDPGPPANITDACGNILVPVLIGAVSNPDPIVCDGTVIWTYQYTACDGSTADWTYTYTISYSGALTPPADGAASVTCPGDAVDPGSPAPITDPCGNTINPVFVGVNTNPDPIICNGTVTWTYRYTACDGTTADWLFIYTVNDNIFPTASNPANLTVECVGDVPPADPNVITDEADNCPGTVTVVWEGDSSDGNSCPETITRTYSVTDACGNSILITQTISVDDTTPPTASSPAAVTVECVGDIPAPDPNIITDEADNCLGALTVAFVDDVSGGGPCPEVFTRTYSVTDACGNSILVTQTITVDDTTPPTASSPAPIDVDCVADIPAPDPNVITDEADNCPGGIVVDFVGDVSDGGLCPETITRTYSVTDACGNITLVNQTITVDDDIAPTASNLAPLSVTCIGDVPAPDPNLVTDEADNCPGTVTVAFVNDVSDGNICPETITRTYSVTDACGNSITVTQTITVDDDVPPTASSPAPLSVDCIADVPAPDPNEITDEADNCPGTLTVAWESDSSDGGICPETITRTYSITDACGNSVLVTQVITVDDDVPPTASSPAAVTVECVGDIPAPDPNVITDEADNCPGALTVAFVDDVSGGGPCPEVFTRTYSVTDACGNSVLVTQSITVDDTTPPTASSPAPIDVDCVADIPAPDPNVITDEADNCPGGIVVDFVGDVSDGGLCPETITRTYSVTDACGNITLVNQTITVDDDIAPTASNLAPLSVTCIGDVPAPDPNLVTDEADNCPGTVTVVFVNDVSDGNICPETITRTYSVTDACGNSITVTQTITVDDDVPPTASSPAPISVDCIADVPAPDPNVISDEADNCPGTLTVAWESDSSDGGICPETITRTYSITDACGNSVLVTQVITVDDDVPPTASSPASVTVECVGDIPAPDPNVITDEADNCPGTLTVAFVDDVSGGGPCPEVFTRTYSVTDACGNSVLVTQSITVDDTTPPTASSPAPIDVDCVADIPAPDPNIITDEADNCPGGIVVDFVGDVSDGGLCPETITRTYSVTDACGNITLVNQTITVDDDIAPTASNLAPLSVTCIGDVPAPDPNLVTDEADNCPGTLTVAFFDDSSDGGSCPETITRSYSVTDACGNQILVTQVITVNDDVPPTASNPAPVNVECSGSVPAPDPLVVTDEADNCPGAIMVAFVSDMTDGGTCPETVTRTYSVTDACGNSILVTQSITIGDIIPPTASDPAPLTLDCIEDLPAPDVNVVTDEADNCSGVLVVAFENETSDGGLCPETITRTYSVTDECGNSIIVTQTITIDDNIPPTASAPAAVDVDCFGDVPAPDPNEITDEADNCTAPVVVAHVGDVPDGASCPLTITRTYSITDACGNQITVDQIITVNDDTPPTASNPSSEILSGCNAPIPGPDISVVLDAADNCGTPVVAFVGDVTDLVGCTETTTRTYSVTDACNNSITVEQLIIRTVDMTPPVFTTPPVDITVNCIAQVPPMVDLDYTDNCSPAGTVVGTETGPSGNPLTIIREWTVTDDCGNTASVMQTITILEVPTETNLVDAICDGQVYVLPDGSSTSVGGMYGPYVFMDINGCDSVVNVDLTVHPPSEGTETYSGCEGDGYTVTVNGTVYNEGNPTGTEILTDINGCDSTVTINLVFNLETSGTETYSGCIGDGYSVVVNGTVYDENNPDGVEVFPGPNGCDSTVTIDLDFAPSSMGSETYTGCSGDGYSVIVNGTVYDENNPTGTETMMGINGCDSIVDINLTFHPLQSGTETYSGCEGDGYAVTVNGTVYDEFNPNGVEILTDINGCDSTVTIDLDFSPVLTGTETYSGCEGDGYSVTVNGTVYNEGNPTGVEMMMSSIGCDSVVTIALTFADTTSGVETYSGCQGDGYSVTVNGTVYDESNPIGEEILPGSNGCDSTVTIMLTFAPAGNGTETYSGCSGDGYSVIVNGTTYDESNPTGVEMFPGQNGCDSTVTIDLYFAPLGMGSETYNGCEGDGYSVTVNGTVYDENNPSGTEVFPGPNGCDSTVVIDLSFSPALMGSETYNGCEGDGYSVVVNGTVYDEDNPTGTEVIVGSGCDSIVEIDLFFAPVIPAEITPAGPLCSTADAITLTAVPPGGTWSGAVSSDQFDPAVLGVGTYEVIYTITGACPTADTIDIVVYELMLSCSTLQNESAPGASDGEGQVSVSGGVPPYDITWTGPPNGSVTLPADGNFVITSLPGGVYTVEVIDATGCVAQCEFTITSPVPCELVIDGVTIQDASCPGVNNGSISIDATSNMPPIEYSIDGGAFGSNNTFTDLAPGPHTIIIRDAGGCEIEQIINVGVGQGPELSLVEVVDASCGQANGSVEVEATGGSTPYTYSIDGINYGLSPLFPGLGAGTYNIYLIDDGGCTDTLPVNVNASGSPLINGVDIDQSSCGQSDGSITINASGGLGDLMFSINGGASFQTSNFFDNLPAGNYLIVVEDEAGCQVTGSATITDEGGPMIDDVIITPTSCGAFDGTITIEASGTPTLQYQIDTDPFQTSNLFENLPSGNYTITVRDGNGCLVSQVVTVNTTDGPQITDVNVTDTECGLDNGAIEIIASGGTGDLMYCINGDCSDENEFPDLPAGTYDILVEDENGCTAESSVTIQSSIGPEFDVYIDPAHCGQADGGFEIDVTQGTPPYQYSQNGAAGPFGPSFTFVNKVSDFYLVAVRDANGCIVEEEIFVWEEEEPEITAILTTDPGCDMTNGTIFIDADSSSNLIYSIQPPLVSQEGPTFINLAPGTYTITVEDEFGCEDTGTAVINDNPNPVLTLNVVNTECGQSIGVITASATGGITPYQYSINNGPFTSNTVFSGLGTGTYIVVVRGNNGCEDTDTVDIIAVGTQFGDLSTSICEGDTLFLHGEEFTMAGDYQVDVPGGATNGCDSIVNLELGIIPLNDVIIAQSICAGDTFTYNGIDYTAAGLYVIDTFPSTTGGCDTIVTIDLDILPLLNTYIDATICEGGVYTINGMDFTTAGEYLIDTVQAGTGCDSIRTLRLAVQDFNQTTVTASICEGDTYTINGMDYTMTGIYNVDTIPGPNSCDTILILDLTVSPLPTANAGADLTLDCDVQSVTLNGSASGGNILWTGPGIDASNETDIMPVVTQPGVYILTVTSSLSCIATDTVVVNLDPEAVVADAGPDAFISCDIDTIFLQASPVGPNYTYQWTGPGINASNENLPNPIVTEPGTYTLVVTDQLSQCVSLPDEVFIDDITVVIIAIIQDPMTLNCFTTSVDLVSTGSSTGPNIVYTWFDEEGNLISSSPGFPVSSEGMFTLIVEDTISGCFDDDSVMVMDLTEYPQVDAGLPQVIDCNHPTVILNEGAVNTNPDLVFEWTGPAGGIIGPDDQITAVAGTAGLYYLTATDINNGCENDDTVTVTDLTSQPLADINIAQTITCIDSIALLDVGNSTTGQDVVYTWSGPGVNNVVADSIETALPGTYFLDVVIESTGCAARDTAILILPAKPTDLIATAEIPICEGDTSGALTITNVSGGTPAYMYALDGGPLQTSAVFDNLMAGQYDIQVVDANGCSYTESFTIADGIPLTIDIGPDIELELGDSVILWADVSLPWSQIDSIVWTPLDILSCEYCTNPTLYGLHNDVVTATVYTGGCIDQDMLNVRVDVDANIYIPNVFSPNDDGINDHVTVFTDHRVRRVVYLEIFDRWGNQVFVGNDFAPNDPLLGWDGTFRGKKMNPAVFAYIARVELLNGDTIDRKGDITIVR